MPRGKLLNGLVTQQKVLRGAVALFLEKGYTRTTTGEIAKAAGIGQSSFFHVFPSKEALLLDMVDDAFTRIHARKQRILDGPGTLAEKLRAVIIALPEEYTCLLYTSDAADD